MLMYFTHASVLCYCLLPYCIASSVYIEIEPSMVMPFKRPPSLIRFARYSFQWSDLGEISGYLTHPSTLPRQPSPRLHIRPRQNANLVSKASNSTRATRTRAAPQTGVSAEYCPQERQFHPVASTSAVVRLLARLPLRGRWN